MRIDLWYHLWLSADLYLPSLTIITGDWALRITRTVKIILSGIALIIIVCVALLYTSGFWPLNSSGNVLYRSVCTIEFTKQSSLIAWLASAFSIERVDNNTVSVLLTLGFKSFYLTSYPNLRTAVQAPERVSMKIILWIEITGEWALYASVPLPSPTEFSLDIGESTVLVNSTFDLSTIDTPTALMFYDISPIELRFLNGSTLLLNDFVEGNCTVESQVTLDKVYSTSGGLYPLWEGDCKYAPSGEACKLAELDGNSLSRRIRVDISRENYSVEKTEGKLDHPSP